MIKSPEFPKQLPKAAKEVALAGAITVAAMIQPGGVLLERVVTTPQPQQSTDFEKVGALRQRRKEDSQQDIKGAPGSKDKNKTTPHLKNTSGGRFTQ